MADLRVLADGRTKFTILIAKPADPSQPTAAELNAGIDASCKVLQEGFSWTFADSDTVNEAPVCATGNAEALGRDNLNLALTLWRYFLAGGGVDPAADGLFAALKVKGTTFWGYTRKLDIPFDEPWAAGQEIAMGAEAIVDNLQDPGGGGWLKYVAPIKGQQGWAFQEVAA